MENIIKIVDTNNAESCEYKTTELVTVVDFLVRDKIIFVDGDEVDLEKYDFAFYGQDFVCDYFKLSGKRFEKYFDEIKKLQFCLSEDKGLYFVVDDDACFNYVRIRDGKVSDYDGLSTREKYIFNYYCFVTILRYALKEREKPALLILGLNTIDTNGVDIPAMLSYAHASGFKTVLFTNPENVCLY